MGGSTKGWPTGHRPCRRCKAMLPYVDFCKDVSCALGLSSCCRRCRKIKTKKYTARAPSPELKMLRQAKRNARRGGYAFDLTLEDIHIPAVCPIYGTPFIAGDHNRCASLDKMVPGKGYVRGNVFIISLRANRLKNNATREELLRILAYMEENS